MESRNMVLMNLFAVQQWRRRHREQICGQRKRGKREGDKWRICYGYIYITICKIDNHWGFAV